MVFLDSENPPIELIPVVREFPEIFCNDLSEIPPKREIYFGIDYLLGTNPVSSHPYQMTPTELK